MGTEDEMVGWHHRLKEHESEQTTGDSEKQGSLACCSLWGHKESDMTERQIFSFLRFHSVGSRYGLLFLILRFVELLESVA